MYTKFILKGTDACYLYALYIQVHDIQINTYTITHLCIY